MPCITPWTFTPWTHCQSLGSVCQASRFATLTPALLHRMWQAPWVSKTWSARDLTDAGSETSHTIPVTSPPSSSVAAFRAGSSTSAITTFMPSPRKALARALPMPLAPPVTTATRFRNSFMVGCSRRRGARPARRMSERHSLPAGTHRTETSAPRRRVAGSRGNRPSRALRQAHGNRKSCDGRGSCGANRGGGSLRGAIRLCLAAP